jgi:hypothetical protein
MRAGMSYFHETIWKGVPKFLRRVDTALKNIGIDERVPYNAPLIQFSSWMGGDRDGKKGSALYCSPQSHFYLLLYLHTNTFNKFRKSKSDTRGYKGRLFACQNDGCEFVLLTD